MKFLFIILLGILLPDQNTKKYFDIEGNEIIYKDNRWRYISPPSIDCNIPFNVFVNYIKENSDITFNNDQEAYRYGIYKMPHVDVCPNLDYTPVVFPINAEYEFKSNWDSLKVGMSQKEVRKWLHFDPMLSFDQQNHEIWKYYGFGYLEFNENEKLVRWTFTGSEHHKVYSKDESISINNRENKDRWYHGLIHKVKKILPWI